MPPGGLDIAGQDVKSRAYICYLRDRSLGDRQSSECRDDACAMGRVGFIWRRLTLRVG